MDDRMLVRDMMAPQVIVASPTATAEELARQMHEKNIGCIVIVGSDQAVIGIVTEKDLVHKVLVGKTNPKEVKASEIMTSPVSTISPNADISEAARLMGKNNIHRLPVVEGTKLVGVITDKDLLNAESNLLDILREFLTMKKGTFQKSEAPSRGICEVCDNFATDLLEIDGVLTCGGCREEEMS